jgi:hypothetical protein
MERGLSELALTPHQADRLVVQARRLLDDLQTDYRWVHSVAYGKTRYSSEGSAPKHRGAVSDPTGGIVTSTDKHYARRALVNATDALADAIRAMQSARYDLAHALPDREPTPTVLGRAAVTRAELAESQAAKVRRESRGEGWGDG